VVRNSLDRKVTDCLKREERRNQAVTKVKVFSHERYINVAVNLVHRWEDSSLGYDDDGFSIHERYRGLSPQQGFEKKDWELGRSILLLSVQKKEVQRRHNKVLKYSQTS